MFNLHSLVYGEIIFFNVDFVSLAIGGHSTFLWGIFPPNCLVKATYIEGKRLVLHLSQVLHILLPTRPVPFGFVGSVFHL